MTINQVVALLGALSTFTLLVILPNVCLAAKVLDLGDKLPELLEKHPEKRWLVKFYAPWCHHCQQIEPTYNNVAERIYHKHDHFIVGRVDCTKYGHVCEEFKVDAYPTIVFVSKEKRVKYTGDRSEDAMITFAERLNGPDINLISNCDQLKEAINKHKMIILSTSKTDSQIEKTFESLAQSYKSDYWFYKFAREPPKKCNNLHIPEESVLLLKQYLNRAIVFDGDQASKNLEQANNKEELLQNAMLDWIRNESFAIYGQIPLRSLERVLASGKSVVLAILDEYKPARRIAPSSQEFDKSFRKLAIKHAQSGEDYNKLLFGWSSDLELVEYITLTSVRTLPNVIILASNLSYHLVAPESPAITADVVDKKTSIPMELSEFNLMQIIGKLKKGQLMLIGGNTYTHAILSYTIGNFNKFIKMYRANPLLVSLIFGFPTIVVVFVIYTTCCYDDDDDDKARSKLHSDDEEEEVDDDDDDDYDRDGNGSVEEQRGLLNSGHLKQD